MAGNNAHFIFLVQHGSAKSKEEDPERPLTDKGRTDVEKVARRSAQVDLQVAEIRHSGKRRAEETANIFAAHFNLEHQVKAVSGLSPNDDVEPLAKDLENQQMNVMIVGHLPFLNRLASRLLVKDPEKTVVQFRNGGIVGLKEESGQWSVSVLVTPEWA